MKAILVIAMLAIFSMAQGQESKNFIDRPYIEVTGKAELEVTPDEIYLNIVIKEADNKNKESVEDLERKMFSAIKKLGIDASKDLVIMDFASNFKTYWLKKSNIYTSKEYQLLVHDGATAGKVFRELERIGISNINIARVDHSEIEKYRQEVKINAIKAGKNKATALTNAIGEKTGKALYIQEINNGYYPRQNFNANIMVRSFAADALGSEVMPEIEFEKIKLEYSILLRFEILE